MEYIDIYDENNSPTEEVKEKQQAHEDEYIQFINQLDKFNIEANTGIAITERKKYEKFGLVYSNLIKDFWYNFIDSIKANSKDELEKILNIAEKEMDLHNRKMCIAMLPRDKYVYNKRDVLFEKSKYECISEETWMIYTDFENVNKIKTNCEVNIELEKTNDMELFGDIMYQTFSTGDADDPYGQLDAGYREAYRNYKEVNNGYKQECYFIKNENTIVGLVNVIYDDEIFGIYGLAVKSEYRNKGIGKEVLKQLLERCSILNRKVAFLQTEKGFYPEQIYKKIGFKEVCTEYYYQYLN